MQYKSVLGPYASVFFEKYWQKKPLLIRGAFPGGLDCIDADSLAGLACQDDCESRLVIERGSYPWQTLHGPFDDDTFQNLPETHWTLLVQAVDRMLPEVSALRQSFHFLPNWRLDDIMISYAADQGSVGPHTDNYDVFLIQGKGRRRWTFGDDAIDGPVFTEGLDLKILKDFRGENTFLLEPGDMLYLPPGVGHHGIADGECLTYSVGFRAPTQNELLISFSQFLQQSENPERFYSDAFTEATRDPGLITDDELSRIRNLMLGAIEDESVFRRWVGAFLSEPRSFHQPSEENLDAAGLQALLGEVPRLDRIEGGRFSYHQLNAKVYLAVEGESLVVPVDLLPLVKTLASQEVYDTKVLMQYAHEDGFADVMLHLWNQGFIRRP